jgi:hypothetical protein
MAHYYVNNKTDDRGDHEVHKEGCSYMPADRKYLGSFTNCYDAVKEAKKTYPNSNGCYWCSRECHTS